MREIKVNRLCRIHNIIIAATGFMCGFTFVVLLAFYSRMDRALLVAVLVMFAVTMVSLFMYVVYPVPLGLKKVVFVTDTHKNQGDYRRDRHEETDPYGSAVKGDKCL